VGIIFIKQVTINLVCLLQCRGGNREENGGNQLALCCSKGMALSAAVGVLQDNQPAVCCSGAEAGIGIDCCQVMRWQQQPNGNDRWNNYKDNNQLAGLLWCWGSIRVQEERHQLNWCLLQSEAVVVATVLLQWWPQQSDKQQKLQGIREKVTTTEKRDSCKGHNQLVVSYSTEWQQGW